VVQRFLPTITLRGMFLVTLVCGLYFGIRAGLPELGQMFLPQIAGVLAAVASLFLPRYPSSTTEVLRTACVSALAAAASALELIAATLLEYHATYGYSSNVKVVVTVCLVVAAHSIVAFGTGTMIGVLRTRGR
jgi:hypothetical protein